ncbi:MAG TPA: UvrD-helicase domain-containing protein [Oligoflexia bacterium]|nr:UvrD-helicase domain-containing protein [Oligoflexia bacterium]HMR25597.1 UvrD-helicase domain-containing protein [Oligoflexia bacterium]
MSRLESFIPLDNDIRLLATENTQKNLSIEAGAGTGKTTLLSQRYVNTILNHNVPLAQCVAITFTEKAALELKQRIHDLLLEKKRPDLAKDVYSAPISTIHAFCSNLLHQKPLAVDLDPGFSQLDPLQQQSFLNNCFNLFLNECLTDLNSEEDLSSSHPSQVLQRLNAYDIDLRKIKTLCLEAYDNRIFFIHTLLKNITWPNTKNFIASLLSSYKKLYDLAITHCKDKDDKAYQAIEHMLNKLQYLTEQSMLEHISSIMFQLKISSRDGAQKKWTDEKTLKYIKTSFAHLKQQLENMQLQLGHCIAYDTLFLLNDFVSFVDQQKKEQSILDFDDLLLLSLRLVKDNASVRQYFQSMYRCFFVDEFQDTDPIQKELIWLLSGLYQSDLKHSTFIVGDPKQSIYRFRGASLETYAHATQDFKSKQQHKPIVQNFRSSEKILDWVNMSFSHLLKEHYHPLKALPAHTGKNPAVVTLQPSEDQEDLNSHASLQAEAQCIALYIKKLLLDQEHFIYDKTTQSYRPAQANDIALIYPTSTGLDYLEEHLRKHGIPFLSQSSRSFFKRSEVEGLIYILNALAQPTDSIALTAALKTCYLAIDDQDLFTLFKQKQNFCLLDIDNTALENLSPPLAKALQSLNQSYHDLHQTASYSLKEILDCILERFFVYPALALRKHQAQAHANIEKFMLLTQYYEQSVSSHLYDFTHWCLSNQDKSHDQPEAAINTQNINAVQLMTMHKSKGLEFPVVIMAQLASKPMPYPNFLKQSHAQRYGFGYTHSGQNMYTHDYAQMINYERNSILQEKKRLLYVACTRAKDRLVISQFSSNNYKDSYHALLQPILQQTQSLLTPFKIENDHDLIQKSLFTDQNRNPDVITQDAKTVFSNYQQAMTSIINWQTKLNALVSVSQQETLKKHTLEQSLATIEKSSFGSAFHKIMQDLTELNFKPEYIGTVLLQHAVDEKQHSQLQPLIQKCLDHQLILQAKKAPICHAEFPLLIKKQNNLTHSMYIDLLFFDGKHWILVDYKTDELEHKNLEQHALIYQKQIIAYQEALKHYNIQLNQAFVFFVRHQHAVDLKI